MGIIVQPLSVVSTSDYNAIFQIAFSSMQDQVFCEIVYSCRILERIKILRMLFSSRNLRRKGINCLLLRCILQMVVIKQIVSTDTREWIPLTS